MDKIRQPFTQDLSKTLTFGTPLHHKTNDSFSIRQHTFVRRPLGKVPKDFIEDDVLKTTLNQSDKFVPNKNPEHSATFPKR